MAIKFPLKMADGAMVRTLEELREHFDMASVLAYYEDGRLKRWLENGYYDNEAAQVDALNASSENFNKELCEILRLDGIQSDVMRQADLGDAKKKNKRIESLKKITADDRILAAVDRVAFTQEELDDLLDHHVDEIYLCGECFMIPECNADITYIGVNNPMVRLDGETMPAGVDFQNVRFDLDLDAYIGDYVDGQREGEAFFNLFEKNLSLGIQLLCAAADNGSAKIQLFLGNCYAYGCGIERSDAEAVKWYRMSAEQGYAAAQNIMGNCCYNGYGIDKDYKKAIEWYKKAAKQGHADAQYGLGRCYDNGYGIDMDCDKAVEWYKKAAKQGHAGAQCALGDSCWSWSEPKEAMEWYKKAAKQGHAGAQYGLGRCYHCGYGGIDMDYKKAVEWYKKAAEQDFADAQYGLGQCYYCGDGVDMDYKKAVEWYKKAAEQGHAEAQYQLGDCYEWGNGVNKDVEEAIKWYKKVAEQDNFEGSKGSTALQRLLQQIAPKPWWKQIF